MILLCVGTRVDILEVLEPPTWRGSMKKITALAIIAVSSMVCAGPKSPARPAAPTPGPGFPVAIGPADSIAELEAKAASVTPSARQLRWQALEFQAFVHFGM